LNFIFLLPSHPSGDEASRNSRNPAFHYDYQLIISEDETKKQALVCVMRRLTNILYGMMNHRTAYVMPNLPEKEAV